MNTAQKIVCGCELCVRGLHLPGAFMISPFDRLSLIWQATISSDAAHSTNFNDGSKLLMQNSERSRKTSLETTTRGQKSTTETSETHFKTETISKASQNPNAEDHVYKSKKKKFQNCMPVSMGPRHLVLLKNGFVCRKAAKCHHSQL